MTEDANYPRIACDADGKFARYTDLGLYPVYHLCDDGEALCANCANREPQVHTDAPDDGWRIVGSGVNWEDPELLCVHCNERIESAYGEPEEE